MLLMYAVGVLTCVKLTQIVYILRDLTFYKSPICTLLLQKIGVTDATIHNANTHIVLIDCACDVSSVGNDNLHTNTKIMRPIDNDELFVTNNNQVVTGDINIDEDSSLPKSITQIAKCSSNYLKCLKTIAYRYRFVVFKLHAKGLKNTVSLERGSIKSSELKRSMIDVVRLAQEVYFGKKNIANIALRNFAYALKHCKKKYCSRLNDLKNLLLFFDSYDKVLRVGGRIVKSTLPLETIHQLILPKSHFVTALIVK